MYFAQADSVTNPRSVPVARTSAATDQASLAPIVSTQKRSRLALLNNPDVMQNP